MHDYDKLKIGAIFITIAEVLVFGMMPVYLHKIIKGTVLNTLNAFAGGALLAISMMHLLSNANKIFSSVSEVWYPIPFLLVVVSFAILLGLHKTFGSEHEHEDDDEKHDHRKLENNKLEGLGPDTQGIEDAIKQKGDEIALPCIVSELNQQQEDQPQDVEIKQVQIEIPKDKNDQKEDKIQAVQTAVSDMQIETEPKEVKATMIGIVLCSVLTIYGILFGIGLGQADNWDNTAQLTANICGHKWVDVLCLSITQAKDKTNKWTMFLCQLPLLLASPIGIIVGMNIPDTDDLAFCLIMSIIAGIILYISSADVISEEFESESNMKKKLLSFLFGIGVIAVFMQFYSDEYR